MRLVFILYCSAFLFASKVDAHILHKLTLKSEDTLRLERNYGRTWYELHILQGQKHAMAQYSHSIYQKLEVNNRTEAINKFLR